ncbi:Txe/YoeB family addiction module toxin (plasmid) [Limosilactobacillus reuteri]|nr:Txe/YoeB family addiction module toxin [Limosilactobacillus reuteri]
MNYAIKVKSGAKRDLKKIKGSYLEKNFLEIIAQLKENPYQNNQSFEKLVPPIKGFYSRRINVQHRVVYKVNEEKKEVVIYSAWGHYE